MVDTDASSASKDTETSKSQVEKSVVNTSTPYSLFASDNPRALITSVMFTRENYNEWSTELVNALRAKRKLGLLMVQYLNPPVMILSSSCGRPSTL